MTNAQYRTLRKAALMSILAADYGRNDNPHADANSQYCDKMLALAALSLVKAINELPEDQRPVGWDNS